MPENYKVYYTALCSKCKHPQKSSSEINFITRFFLPSMCENCGQYADWLRRYTKWKRIPAKKSLYKPWTWFYFDDWVIDEENIEKCPM